LIDSVYQQAARHPGKMRMAFSEADIVSTHKEHKLAALMGIEASFRSRTTKANRVLR